ncbi:unnamed protein product [Mytilus edulis]|uniref:Uncharacterized protein n=1 Tax=Mytilus edulis TaxID=6550 RepID=A0A8S3PZ40_MYTED|nr:unnamed protein product [Mytilus edulis]
MTATGSTHTSFLKRNASEIEDIHVKCSYKVSDIHLLLLSVITFCSLFMILFVCFCMVKKLLPEDSNALTWISSYVTNSPECVSVLDDYQTKKAKKSTKFHRITEEHVENTTDASMLELNFTSVQKDHVVESRIESDVHLPVFIAMLVCACFVICLACIYMVRKIPADNFNLTWFSSYVSNAREWVSVLDDNENKKEKCSTNFQSINEESIESQLHS